MLSRNAQCDTHLIQFCFTPFCVCGVCLCADWTGELPPLLSLFLPLPKDSIRRALICVIACVSAG